MSFPARWALAPLLLPLSWLFGAVVTLRGWLYDRGVLPSFPSPVPTLGVGNLTVGGTGKSPMVYWLCAQLARQRSLAVLSRGYGRRTRGYREVRADDASLDVGDEPLMLRRMLDAAGLDVVVAVCEDRVLGCRTLAERYSALALIVLDDAFQHRRLRLDCSVLLTDYGRLHCHDHFLPYGRRRDALRQARRADAVVVTKCPHSVFESPVERKRLVRLLQRDGQFIAYSCLLHGAPTRLSPQPLGDDFGLAAHTCVGLWGLSGIANPRPFLDALRQLAESHGVPVGGHTTLGDHAPYSPQLLAQLEAKAQEGMLIVTTAKDAARFGHMLGAYPALAARGWVLPVGMAFWDAGGRQLLGIMASRLSMNL